MKRGLLLLIIAQTHYSISLSKNTHRDWEVIYSGLFKETNCMDDEKIKMHGIYCDCFVALKTLEEFWCTIIINTVKNIYIEKYNFIKIKATPKYMMVTIVCLYMIITVIYLEINLLAFPHWKFKTKKVKIEGYKSHSFIEMGSIFSEIII